MATADENGLVKAHNKEGTAVISVTTEEGNKTATCNLKVRKAFIRCFNEQNIYGGGFGRQNTDVRSVTVNGTSATYDVKSEGTVIGLRNRTMRAGDRVVVTLRDNSYSLSSENFKADCK